MAEYLCKICYLDVLEGYYHKECIDRVNKVVDLPPVFVKNYCNCKEACCKYHNID